PLALLEGFGPANTQAFHYQLDHLGTPQELTNAQGKIVWSAHYRAYGQIARLDVDTVDNPLRFQGQYFDRESGLHYNRHRYYNPDNGRYLTPDPVKLAGGLNGYLYVPNPTGWVDPLGLNSCPGDGRCKATTEVVNPSTEAKVNEGEPHGPLAGTRPTEFATKEKLDAHYIKHGAEFGAQNSHDYLVTARHVVNEGIPVRFSYRNTPTTGYVLLMGTSGKGQAKFAFAGVNNAGQITTLHTKSGKEFWRTINGNATEKIIRPYTE
ncbi:type IV secretion protein Rhs, partial [Pseudomonas gessardii]